MSSEGSRTPFRFSSRNAVKVTSRFTGVGEAGPELPEHAAASRGAITMLTGILMGAKDPITAGHCASEPRYILIDPRPSR